MRIRLTKYGWPQTVIFPTTVIAAMIICLWVGQAFLPLGAIISVEVILAIVMIWILSFFRDPHRSVPSDNTLLLAPADGKITDIEIVEKDNLIGTPALRIGIFLSIFNVHINRAPCNVRVEKITYKKGKYKNAMSPESSRVNESNDVTMTRIDNPKNRLLIRQISGAIARRIVCEAKKGQELTGGKRFGMIKFGSRTELYLPADQHCQTQDVQYEAKCMVKIGDKVKAGLTPIIKYEIKND